MGLFFKKKKTQPEDSNGIHDFRTVNVIVDTFDLIKKITYIFELGIQLIYIGYLIVKLVMNSGVFIGNIILLSLSIIYLIYHIIITDYIFKNHEEAKEIKKKHKKIKLVFRILKRITNGAIIGLTIFTLVRDNVYEPLDLLFLTLMLVGFIASIVCDIIIALIDARIQIIKDAVAIDIVNFKNEHKYLGKVFNKFSSTKDMEVTEEQIERVEVIRNRIKEKHPHLFKRNKDQKEDVKEIDFTEQK